jgi:hypothetical protein
MDEIASVEGDAQEIGWYEAELGSADTDHADNGAIQRSNNPTLPELFAEEDGSQNSQNAGEIIESNHVKHA